MATLFQVILQVPDVKRAQDFYSELLQQPGRRISEREHAFECGGVILTCQGPAEEEAPQARPAMPDPSRASHNVRLSVPDLAASFERAKTLDCVLLDQKIVTEPWGAQSFRVKDCFGNLITLVDEQTMRQQLAEAQATTQTDLRPGMPLYLYSLQPKPPRRVPGSVVRIFPGEIWVRLSLAQEARIPGFAEDDTLRLQYEEASKAYTGQTRIVKVSPLASEYVAITAPEEIVLIQRRTSPRVAVQLPVSYLVVQAADPALVSDEISKATSRDISTAGAAIETTRALQIGDELQLQLVLPPSKSKITTLARVIWAEPINTPEETAYRLGLRFLEVSLEDQIRILKFLIETQESIGLDMER